MNVSYIIVSIVSVLAVGAIFYTIVYVADRKRKLADREEELDALRLEQAELSDLSDSDSDDEDFQDLRHHRLIHEPRNRLPRPNMENGASTATMRHTLPRQRAQLARANAQDATQAQDESSKQHAPTQIQYQMPAPPGVEEYNDVRVFYATSLPVTLDNLNVENCVECELLDAVIPRGDYVIHSRNKTFQVRQPFEASVQTFTDVVIPEGDYSASTLATTITTLVTTAGLTGFSLLYTSLTKNYRVQDDSVIDISFNESLAYDLGWGSTPHLSIGSVRFPIAANGSYEVTAASQSFEVSVNSGAYATYTIAIGTYTATTLGAAINTALVSPLAASYLSDGDPSIVVYHSTGAAIDVRLSQGLMEILNQASNLGSSVYDSGLSVYYATSTRADLYGSRYVEIKTAELNAPHLHRRGVLQAAFLANEITNWQSTGADTLRRRRFPAPISIRRLTVRFQERHPSNSNESGFYDMELNGLAVSMTICFRRLRYKNEAQHAQLGTH